MKFQLAGLAAAAALLTACGSGTTVADGPATGSPHRQDVRPHWPAEGCAVRSGSSIDHASGTAGADTPEEALAAYNPEDLSVVREEKRPHREHRWLLVDEEREIVRAVSMFRGDDGWLVDGVEECSG